MLRRIYLTSWPPCWSVKGFSLASFDKVYGNMAETPLSIESLGDWLLTLHWSARFRLLRIDLDNWKWANYHNSDNNSRIYTDSSANNQDYWDMHAIKIT